ncbi:MAG: hypothetical protein J0I41_09750 [Filimonas sp.]|nr:hypothetical protein [Filimonas sp.]
MNGQLWLKMANLVFDLNKKIARDNNTQVERIKTKMEQVLEEAGFFLYNPTGEKYAETRTDVEANISGEVSADMYITDVIKPVVYTEENGMKILLQKGIVIVSGK